MQNTSAVVEVCAPPFWSSSEKSSLLHTITDDAHLSPASTFYDCSSSMEAGLVVTHRFTTSTVCNLGATGWCADTQLPLTHTHIPYCSLVLQQVVNLSRGHQIRLTGQYVQTHLSASRMHAFACIRILHCIAAGVYVHIHFRDLSLRNCDGGPLEDISKAVEPREVQERAQCF